MVRPLAVVNYTFFAAIVVVLIFGISSVNLIIPVAVICLSISLKSKKLRKAGYMTAICITSVIAVIWVTCFTWVYVDPTDKLGGTDAYITGELCDNPYKQNGRYYYKLNTERIEAEDCIQNTTVLISSEKELNVQPYDTIYAAVTFYPRERDSYYYYNISRRNFVSGTIKSEENIRIYHNEGNKPLYYYALKIRQKMISTINELLPEYEASVVSAVLLGDKFTLQQEDIKNFRTSGISHVIVVSGFHLAVITEIMVRLFTVLCFGRKRAATFISVAFVFLYMAVAGFTPSVVRAGIMQIVVLFGKTMIWSDDPITSLSIASMIICFINPYTALDIGFLLSFSATLGICLWSPKMFTAVQRRFYPLNKKPEGFMKKIKKPFEAFIALITVTLSASVFTLPVIMIVFRTVSLYGVITNTLVSPVVSLLIISSLIMVLLGMGILRVLAVPAAALNIWLVRYITAVAQTVAGLPFSRMLMSSEFVPYCIAVSMVMLTFTIIIWKGKKHILIFVCILMIIGNFCAGAAFERIIKSGSVKISVLDCGSGTSMILSDDKDVMVLSCGGDSGKGSKLKNYLDYIGTDKISYMLMLDMKNSSTRYSGYLLDNFDVCTLHVYDEEKYSPQRRFSMQSSREIIYSDSTDKKVVNVKNDVADIQIYKTKKCSCLYFGINDTYFLMCGNGTDCIEIPSDWQDADYLIDGGDLKNADVLKIKNVIISGTEDDIQNLSNYTENIICISGKGNYYLRIYPDNTLIKGREGYWLN